MRSVLCVTLLCLSLPLITCHSTSEWMRGAAGVWHHAHHGHDHVVGKHGVDQQHRVKSETFMEPSLSSSMAADMSASLTLSRYTFSNNDPLTVSWALSNRSSTWNPTLDWIGLYAIDIATGDSDYVDWQWTNVSPTNSQGYGSMLFPHLVHLRSRYVLRYYTFESLSYVNIGESQIIVPNDMAEPTHIHLALTNDPSSMTISWTSSSTVYHSVMYRCYSPQCNATWYYTDSVQTTYKATDMCGAPANLTSGVAWFINPGYLHTATLTSLCHPSCKYVFRVGIGDMWTTNYFFTTQADAGTDVTVKFLAYGDMGEGAAPGASSTASRSLDVIEKSCANPPCIDGVLHIGDISYARGNALLWDTYMNLIEPITSKVPYMINIGNHEYDHISGASNDPSGAGIGFHPTWGNYGDDSFGECSVPVFHRFTMPSNGHGLYWYSFESGPVHIIMMSTEHDYTPSSPQYTWLQQDLANVNREKTPWIIVGGHRPMYCSEQYASDYQVTLGMQQAFESLLYKYHVDLAIWGHYHSYERTCAVYNNTCDPHGTVHVVMGMAGASLDNVGYKNLSWSLYHDQVFGYTTIEVTRSQLSMKYYHNVDDALADSLVLSRNTTTWDDSFDD